MYKFAVLIITISLSIFALPAYAETSCTAVDRHINTFDCPSTSSHFICGAGPAYSCPISIPTLISGGNQEYNCNDLSCAVRCVGSFMDCDRVVSNGCEETSHAGEECTSGGRTGTWDACRTSCTVTARPFVTLAPFDAQIDNVIGPTPSIWISKRAEGGDMLKLQRAGADKFIVNNSGQLVMGLGWTQILSNSNENLIYGGISSSSNVGNVLFFQKEPNLTLLQLDNAGNLTVGKDLIVQGLLKLKDLISDPTGTPATGSIFYNATEHKIKVYDGGWSAVGGGTTYAQGDYITIAGNVISAVHGVNKCFGPILRGVSATSDNGDADGYRGANAQCTEERHVCTAQEILQSINCGVFASAGITDGTRLWVSNGAPSLPTPTNDCDGWTDDNTPERGWQGIVWEYSDTGGTFFAESCGVPHQFACCK